MLRLQLQITELSKLRSLYKLRIVSERVITTHNAFLGFLRAGFWVSTGSSGIVGQGRPLGREGLSINGAISGKILLKYY